MAALSKMQARRWLKKAGRMAGWMAPVVFFGLALWALHDSLREYRTADIAAAFGELAPARIALSLALTACGYLVLAGYDLLAFRHIGRRPDGIGKLRPLVRKFDAESHGFDRNQNVREEDHGVDTDDSIRL